MSESSWKFSELKAPRPSFDAIKTLYEDAIESIKNAKSGDDVFEALFENNLLVRRANELREIISIRHAMDVLDERYADDQKWADEYCPILEKLELDFQEAIYDSPYKDEVEEQIGSIYFNRIEVKRKTVKEEVAKATADMKDEIEELQDKNTRLEMQSNEDLTEFRVQTKVMQEVCNDCMTVIARVSAKDKDKALKMAEGLKTILATKIESVNGLLS